MKKLLKALIGLYAVSALVGVLLSAAYTQTVSEELARLRRESRSDIVYLRTRVRELEGELKTSFLDRWAESPETEASVDTEDVTDLPETETAADTEAGTEVGEEAVTIPTHSSPETAEPDGDTVDTAAPVALYLLTVHEGRIGVLDASGELLRTVNVFVMTLPEAEQEALAVGIPAYSEEEMLSLLEQYE